MRRLETYDWWPQLVAVKDVLSLREMAERFEVTPGAITAALKRQGIARQAAPPGPRIHRKNRPEEALPPEPGEEMSEAGEAKARAAERRLVRPDSAREAAAAAPSSGVRPGSKDDAIAPHHDLLGTVPDRTVAELADVSMRTIAEYRKRHGIPGFIPGEADAPTGSRLDGFQDLLGTVPDRIVAEKAGVSLSTVRAYRTRHKIPAAPVTSPSSVSAPAPAPARPARSVASGALAYRIRFGATGDGAARIVVADDIAAAAGRAIASGLGRVCAIELIGESL